MTALIVLLLLAALVFGGVGLVVDGLEWLLITALMLVLASFIFRTTTTRKGSV